MDPLGRRKARARIQENAQELLPRNERPCSHQYFNHHLEPPEETRAQGPANLFEEDNEDITYQQKLKLSEELSFLSSEQLAKVLDEIATRCPAAYRDMGDGRGQVLVDSMDLIFFNEISL
jgi:hypothetical protein